MFDEAEEGRLVGGGLAGAGGGLARCWRGEFGDLGPHQGAESERARNELSGRRERGEQGDDKMVFSLACVLPRSTQLSQRDDEGLPEKAMHWQREITTKRGNRLLAIYSAGEKSGQYSCSAGDEAVRREAYFGRNCGCKRSKPRQ